jgi:uncharacterized membrane protein
MEFSLILSVAMAAVLILGGIVLGVVAFFRSERVARAVQDQAGELARLRSQLEALERSPVPTATVVAPAAPQTAAAAAPIAKPSVPSITPAAPTTAQQAHGLMQWLEELIGGHLAVLTGGLALALGGVFLVRYTIEQGLLGPAGRIGLGALFAAALAAGAEYLRRGQQRPTTGAYIPGALMAAAIVTGFATVYAAFALYGFINGPEAFVLLGLVGFAALAVSSLHGPALAALGLIGSYATPVLVGGAEPDAWLLFSYLTTVTAACYFTSFLRRWTWLAIAATALADLWGVFWLLLQVPSAAPHLWPLAVYTVALLASAIMLLHRNEAAADPVAPSDRSGLGLTGIDRPLTGMLASHSLLTICLSLIDGLQPPSAWTLVAMLALLFGAAWSWRSLASGPAIAAVAALTSYVVARDPLQPLYNGTPSEVMPLAVTSYLWTGALIASAFAAAGTWAFFGRRSNAVWPAVAVAVPLGILVYGYWISTGYAASISFALIAALSACGAAVVAETANRRPRSTLTDWGVAVYASGAVAFLALGLSMVLERGWLTIALALMAPGIAIIERVRPIPVLRWLIALLAALVALRLLTEPGIVGGDPGRTPVVNWLLYAYGVPVLAFWYAARRMLQGRDDTAVRLVEGAAVAFLAALIGVEIRHLMTGGDITRPLRALGEFGLHTLSWLGLAIGLRLHGGGDGGRLVYRCAVYLFGGAGTASLLLINLLLRNPAVTGNPVGSDLVFNDLLLAYGLPALLCGVLYWLARGVSPRWLAWIPGTAALVLAFAYLTFMVARIFEGPQITLAEVRDGELYAMSVAWIGFALALLAAGIRYGSAVLRQAAFGVLLLATLKVFLIDLAGLTGLQQAGSFIGLGLALIGIGLAYQRLVLKSPAASQPPGTS